MARTEVPDRETEGLNDGAKPRKQRKREVPGDVPAAGRRLRGLSVMAGGAALSDLAIPPASVIFVENHCDMTPILTPREALAAMERSAAAKLRNPAHKTLLLAFMAGAFIAMGGLLSILVGFGFPAAATAPGLQRLLSGAVFPLGLVLVVFTGAELFTGNNAVLVPGALDRSHGWKQVARNWALVWAGNFAGALFFGGVLVVLPELLSQPIWHDAACAIARAKVSLPWTTVFLRGIGANWLVCLAVWLGLCATETPGRILGLVLPVAGFVAMGYEHSIANMFFIPTGMMLGADVTVAQLLWDNLLPATLGNIAGGGLFVGALHAYLWQK